MMFEDIVALVTSLDPLDANGERLKVDIETQLESFGARIVKRLCKSITHVILLMDGKCSLKEIENPRKRISSLLERIEKMPNPPLIMSSDWVVESIDSNKRLPEASYLMCGNNETTSCMVDDRYSEDSYVPGKATQHVADILAVDLPGIKRKHEDDLNVGRARRSKVRGKCKAGSKGEINKNIRKNRNGNKKEKSNQINVANRYSMRRLKSDLNKSLIVHKGSPLPGTLPSPSCDVIIRGTSRKTSQRPKKETSKTSIPIPGISRVNSPWNETLSRCSLEKSVRGSRHINALFYSSSTPDPRSNLASQQSVNSRNEGSSPTKSVKTPWTYYKSVNCHSRLPSPWSVHRAWDLRKVDIKCSTPIAEVSEIDEHPVKKDKSNIKLDTLVSRKSEMNNKHLSSLMDENASTWDGDRTEISMREKLGENISPLTNISNLSRKRTKLKESKKENGNSRTDGLVRFPTRFSNQKMITVTSTKTGIADLCCHATRNLSGLKLYSANHTRDDAFLTHVIIEKPRRTLKTMLGICNGAWFLDPQYITDSLEASEWLPEESYVANVPFAAAAARARSILSDPNSSKLLEGHSVCFVPSCGPKKSGKRGELTYLQMLQRVALALGANLTSGTNCDVCIVYDDDYMFEDVDNRSLLSGPVPTVRKEWLLMSAEEYSLLPMENFLIAPKR